MDKVTQLKNAIEFAKQNPDAPQSVQLRRRIESGMYNAELAQIKASQPKTKDEKLAKAGKIGETLGSIFGGSKIGEAIGTGVARRDVESGKTEMELIDYSSLSPQAIERLKAKGVPVTEEEQRAEIAQGIKGPSAKEIAGDVAKIGLNFVGAGTATKAVGAVKAAPTIMQAIGAGAKTGALLGGASGVASGLQEDESAVDIIKQGVIGAGAGGVIGGAIGGLTNAIPKVASNISKARTEKQQNKILENITPKADELSIKKYEKLLSQGKITEKTATSPAQYVLSDQEREIALRNANLIKKDPVKTIKNIIGELERKNADVGNYLKNNNGIFNKGELRNYLRSSIDEISDVSVDDKILSKNKNKFVKNFIDSVEKNDLETLWKTRKDFDRQIEKAFGSSSLSNKMKVELRNAVQDFISEKTDDVTYKAAMKEMSGLFRLKDTVATKAGKERARSAIQQWIKENPGKANIIKLIGGYAVADKLGVI